MMPTTLMPMTQALFAAEDKGNAAFAAALNIPLPFDWPPEFHDGKTRGHLRALLDQPAEDAVFTPYYILSEGRPVGTCGFALVDRRPHPDLGEILTYLCPRPVA